MSDQLKPARPRGRTKQLGKFNRRMLKFYGASEFIRRLRAEAEMDTP